LGKSDPGIIHYGATEQPHFDLDSELARKGANMAKRFKEMGLLGNNITVAGRMA
jgi:hypothetical protein